ncbi:MAG: hypothetical protein ACXU9A_05460 [Xanthobacteraceae bacterium]
MATTPTPWRYREQPAATPHQPIWRVIAQRPRQRRERRHARLYRHRHVGERQSRRRPRHRCGIIAGIENVIGGSGADSLTGDSGNTRLDGGAAGDTMVGGLGNDTYVVDNVGNVVTENANEGTDTVLRVFC